MKDLLEVYDAMKLVVQWQAMYEFCQHRGKEVDGAKCVSCAYYANKVCDKMSTTEVLSIAANIFAKHI